ncbi:MAG: heme-binding protein [Alphaproteobacteria bacterium]|nr:heme-binding protein [Alphaproteobacteria bacterium]
MHQVTKHSLWRVNSARATLNCYSTGGCRGLGERAMTRLSLADAANIVNHAMRVAQAAGHGPMAVVVLDGGGHLVAFQRQETAPFLYADMAIGKAWATIAALRSSRVQQKMGARPGLIESLSDMSDGRFLAVPGGVMIRNVAGEVIGAAGVAGRSGGEEGEACVLQAIAAAGLSGDAGEA